MGPDADTSISRQPERLGSSIVRYPEDESDYEATRRGNQGAEGPDDCRFKVPCRNMANRPETVGINNRGADDKREGGDIEGGAEGSGTQARKGTAAKANAQIPTASSGAQRTRRELSQTLPSPLAFPLPWPL